MMLRDAGTREHKRAQELVAEKKVPGSVTFEDLLSHASYDPREDEIVLTFGGVAHRWKVGGA